MKTTIAALALAISLVACSNPTTKVVQFASQGGSTATGTATIEKLASGGFKTTLDLKGLSPSTNYLGHYHVKGTASTDPCASGGGLANSSLFPSTASDASGNLTLTWTSPSTITDFANMGAYINVHLASALGTVPLCANVTAVTF